jgi:hypothetical protein
METIVIVVSCLCFGFVSGYILRGFSTLNLTERERLTIAGSIWNWSECISQARSENWVHFIIASDGYRVNPLTEDEMFDLAIRIDPVHRDVEKLWDEEPAERDSVTVGTMKFDIYWIDAKPERPGYPIMGIEFEDAGKCFFADPMFEVWSSERNWKSVKRYAVLA